MEKLSAHLYINQEERQALLAKNDWRAAVEILQHYAWIVFAFALVFYWPNVLTVLVALFILGGKQLACAILMHDASHRSMFTNPELNDFVGKWLGAYPIFQDMLAYRPYHIQHHIKTGTQEDPDLLLTRGYPTNRKSMLRKLFRDLSGITGLKAYLGLLGVHLGFLQYNLGGKVEWIDQKRRSPLSLLKTFINKLGGPILVNGLLFALLYLIAAPELYALWIIAMLTTFQFSLRIRSMAEHSMVANQIDPIRNTRTTYANGIERLLFAPYQVNYHLEHHMLMTVPSYNLPRMHLLLKERGFYEKGLLEKNYWQIIKLAIRKKPVH